MSMTRTSAATPRSSPSSTRRSTYRAVMGLMTPSMRPTRTVLESSAANAMTGHAERHRDDRCEAQRDAHESRIDPAGQPSSRSRTGARPRSTYQSETHSAPYLARKSSTTCRRAAASSAIGSLHRGDLGLPYPDPAARVAPRGCDTSPRRDRCAARPRRPRSAHHTVVSCGRPVFRPRVTSTTSSASPRAFSSARFHAQTIAARSSGARRDSAACWCSPVRRRPAVTAREALDDRLRRRLRERGDRARRIDERIVVREENAERAHASRGPTACDRPRADRRRARGRRARRPSAGRLDRARAAPLRPAAPRRTACDGASTASCSCGSDPTARRPARREVRAGRG